MIPDWRELAHCCRCDLITKKCMTYFSWRISNKMKNGHYVQNASVIVSWFLQFKTKAWSLIKINKLHLSIFQGQHQITRETCLTHVFRLHRVLYCWKVFSGCFFASLMSKYFSAKDLWLLITPQLICFRLCCCDVTLMVCGIHSSQKLLCLVN